MIIATQELINQKKDFKYNILADIQKLENLKKALSKIKNKNTIIEIYDSGSLLKTSKTPTPVKDHINKTGINPIIGNEIIEFKDISQLYSNKKGITTDCCGYNLKDKNKNSSHFLCIFSIVVAYLGFNKIYGFVIDEEN